MTFQPPGGEFLLFLVVAVILVPVQSGFEEVFLRGYLLQGLMQFLRNKVVLAILTGVIFALPHLANPEPRSIAICCSPTSWSTC
jgi:membrane protease YdiL (CAAX protease family)